MTGGGASGRPVRLAGLLLLAGVAVTGAAVAAGFGTLELSTRETGWEAAPEATSTPVAVEPPPLGDSAFPEESSASWLATVFQWVLIVVAVVAAVLVSWLLWRQLRQIVLRPRWLRVRGLRGAASATVHEGVLTDPAADEQELYEAVSEAVIRSEDDQDPRRAVIACWVRLTEAAEQSGVPRHRSDTATDFVVRLLRGRQVSESVLGEFAEVYRRARFASHPVDERMRGEARSALERLRGELANRPGVVPAGPAGPAGDGAVAGGSGAAG